MLAHPLHRGRCEVLVDELHGHRALADGRGQRFVEPTDIAGGEDAGHARLEQVLGAGRVAGEDEAVRRRAATDSPSHSVHGCGAEEEEQERERQPLAALERDRFELPVLPCSAAISLRSRTATP